MNKGPALLESTNLEWKTNRSNCPIVEQISIALILGGDPRLNANYFRDFNVDWLQRAYVNGVHKQLN